MKPFQCVLCPKTFGRLDSLNRHTKLHKRTLSHASCDSVPPSLTHILQDNGVHAEGPLVHTSNITASIPNSSPYAGDERLPGDLSMSQPWMDSEDLLQILLSGSLPSLDSLPITQFTPTAFSDSYLLSEPADDLNQGQVYERPANQGQQAVAQMARLIHDLVKLVLSYIFHE